MKPTSPPRWLARLFAFLFYGQLVGYVLAGCLLVGTRLHKSTPLNTHLVGLRVPLHGKVSAPLSGRPNDETIRNWNATPPDDHTLRVGMVAALSRTNLVNDTYWIQFSAGKWTHFPQLPFTVLLLTASGNVLSMFLGLYICYLFMRLFQRLADQQIFDRLQIQRLMRIGQSLLVYALLIFVCQLLAHEIMIHYLRSYGYTVQRFPAISISTRPSIEFISLLTGLCILALTQVFNYGMQLKQENELTI